MHNEAGGQIIGYSLSKKGDRTFRAYDPVRQEQISEVFTDATTEEVNAAAALAAAAFKKYGNLPGRERAGFLHAIAAGLEALGDELTQAAARETGLPAGRLNGERSRTVNQLRLFARLLEEGSWVNARIDTADAAKQLPDLRQMQVPLGVTSIFGASNFPLAFSVAGGDTASALAAGCPVLFKAHPAHPRTSFLVGNAIKEAALVCNMPEGVFSLLQGSSHEVGMALVNHPLVSAIGFTGSFRGGKALFDAACRREKPIPVFAEMGSVNPVFLLPGALKEKGEALAGGLLGSVTLGTGQFCTNPGLFVTMDAPEAEAFALVLKEKLKDAESGPMLTRGIHSSYTAGIRRLTEEFNLKNISGGGPEKEGMACAQFLETDVETVLKFPAVAEEVFGPGSVHVRAKTFEELLKLAENLEGQLTVTIHGTEEDLENYGELVAVLREKAGRLIFNGFPTGVAVSPAMVHGGPYPATTFPSGTSVGTMAIYRFTRPVCYQDFPQASLPEELADENPLGIWRLVNGEFTKNL
ncbi:NADP-dependent aldehyde dehydrogenase [Anseongella ginsenosidimutans]|uniref:NADP-dependent aldehyde dehydrogenase n=1 Tax=Anseongella ginsenosidimutans TaxID=496056 RepID=A0A4R3KPU4_9SPHI|nr:aldehyde dehydrogenase (NADP(+)) [Anseongella ginsenosidimutans]QEC52208.1 aldehyde dehydrogenase (NADP(+)) [Anseongella ginsenosidimutans]TCS86756.1 NADP-dependent aldehyde dehydrogenase [Anseongella ginsenosidimutans]